jgi:zinc D-Ala-D-Ala carboxypeptidase
MISEHITLAEATKSQQASRLGLSNQPTSEHLDNMKHIAENVFEPIRKHFNKPIAVSSFYRSEAVNKAIGGAMTSQHLTGEAMDIDAQIFGGLTNKEVFDWVRANLNFDQLIWEGGTVEEPDWVHVSLTKHRANRKQVLRMISGKYFNM